MIRPDILNYKNHERDKYFDDVEMYADFLEDTLQKIKAWIEAYPLGVFPEPDFKKAAKVLGENGMTLDSISASNMRHVLVGIRNIIDNNRIHLMSR